MVAKPVTIARGTYSHCEAYLKISQLPSMAETQSMVRKRYTKLVVGISKGAPQALTLYGVVIGMGQYIPAFAESRKVIIYFSYSTGSGLNSP